MPCYSAYGLVVDSDIDLPELVQVVGAADVAIRLGSVPVVEHKATLREEYVFNNDCGAFRIRDGCEILVELKPCAAPQVVRLLLLGRVMAFLLRQRGWLPLHSSAVMIDRRGVLFLGPSGTGKSTTASAFYRSGHAVIADDVAAVMAGSGRCVIQPGQSRVRLLEDSGYLLAGLHARPPEFQLDKLSYHLADHGVRDLIPLQRIYVLETGEEFATERLSGVCATALLANHSFVKRTRSQISVLKEHLRHCAAVASMVPVYRLVRPSGLSRLADLVQLVEDEIRTEGSLATHCLAVDAAVQD